MSWWKFTGSVVRFLSRLVDVVTADTAGRCWTRAALFYLGTIAIGAAALGTVVGADAAVSGDSLSTVTSALHGVEIELWNEFSREGPLTRAVYGLMHWAVLLVVYIADGAATAGYALPALGYVAQGSQFIMVVVAAAATMNACQAAWLSGRRPDDPGDGGEPA